MYQFNWEGNYDNEAGIWLSNNLIIYDNENARIGLRPSTCGVEVLKKEKRDYGDKIKWYWNRM